MEPLVLWFALFVCSAATALVGRSHGWHPFGAALLGFFLGPVGLLIVALMADPQVQCCECGGMRVKHYNRCRHCGAETAKRPLKPEWEEV